MKKLTYLWLKKCAFIHQRVRWMKASVLCNVFMNAEHTEFRYHCCGSIYPRLMFHCMNVSLIPALSLNLHRCTLSGTCCLGSASPLLPSCSWLWFMRLAGSSDTQVRQSDAYGISARVICLPSLARSRLVSASWMFHEAVATPGVHIQLQLSPTHPPSTSTTLTHLLDLSLVLRPLIIISGFLFIVLANASFICNPTLLSVYSCLKGRWSLWSVATGCYI